MCKNRELFTPPPATVHIFFFFGLFRAAPGAYGGSQARSRIGAVAAGLRHSHSNARSEPVCDLYHSSWQCQILNLLREARDQTFVLVDASQIPFTESWRELPTFYLHHPELTSVSSLSCFSPCSSTVCTNTRVGEGVLFFTDLGL